MEREYIAFISYRHTPVDREAAVTLQRLIERYRIPKALRRDGEPHLGTIFRDTDELNVSPDLSQSLCTAMDHSEYMIAICSPQYKESAWCREEISYFLKHHDIDHVLPVLVSGEPADAFPEELWRRSVVEGEETVSEPLAANVAGKTVKEMRQNIKREYLRLVAGILGCHYDDLVQRQRRYERRRGAVAIGAVFAVLLAFIGTLLVKNAQINARYQEARENQARYLSTIALEQYGEGDAKSALESILTVLPEGKEKGPVVPEQMYALATVLNAYNNSYVPENYISLPKNDRKVFSENGKNLFSYTSDQLEVYDTDSGEICYTFRPNTFFGEGTSAGAEFTNAGRAVIKNVVPEKNGRFLVQLTWHVFEFDINDPAYYRNIVSAENSLDCICYAQGRLAISWRSANVQVYDCASGELLYEMDFNSGETAGWYTIEALAWNEDGSMLAVGLNYSNTEIQTSILRVDPELNRQEEEYFQKNPPLGLVLIDPLSSEMKKVSSRRTMEVIFAGDAVGAVHKKYPPYIAASNSYIGPSAIWTAAVYDATSGENIYLSDPVLGETHNSFGFSQGQITVDNKARSVYSLWMGKTGIVLDAENGSILGTETFHADIADMEYHRDANIMVILSSGSLQMIAFSDSEYLRTNVMKLDIEVEDAAKSGESYYLLTDTGVIRCGLSRWQNDAAVTAVSGEDAGLKDYEVTAFHYLDTAQGTLRLVGFEVSGLSRLVEEYSALALYPCLSDEALFSYASDDPESEIEAYYVAKGGTHISILERKPDDSVFVSRFSLPDGTLKFCHQLISETMSYDAEAGFSEDGKLLWITRQDTVHFYDLDGNDICLTEYRADDRITCPTLTEDSRYLLWLEKGSLVLLRVETGETERVALPEQFYVDEYGSDNTLLLGQNGLVILYDKKREILFYDMEKSEFLDSISVPSGSEIALLGNKSELLVAHDETVSLYDLSTGQRESTLAIPCVVDRLVTDTGSDAFAVYRGGSYSSGNDDGWTTGGYYMISADEARNMYLTAFISGLNANAVSPSGGEIVNTTSEGFEFTQILDFEQLLEIASRR